MPYFPMYINLEKKKCLVIGGGSIALRKVQVLLDFGARVQVVAMDIVAEIKANPDVEWVERTWRAKDVEGCELVVAATNDIEENHRIAQVCREKKIPVNAVDQKEDCSFLFPAYLRQDEVVASFSSSGQSPVITQYLKEQMRPVMTQRLGEIAEELGELRELVKRQVDTEAERKALYQEILNKSIEKDKVLDREEIMQIIKRYSR